MLMFYRRRSSPKHRYDMIEVDYGGGGHRTRLKDQLVNLCVLGCPMPPYIKQLGGRRSAKEEGAPRGESYSYRE